jgi:hydroxymethylpyrimidine/phosphomethylpyrimidine kinase
LSSPDRISGGGAGIQADIKTITMLGGHAMTAITAVTAQNTLGCTDVHPCPSTWCWRRSIAVVADIGGGRGQDRDDRIGPATADAVAERLEALKGVRWWCSIR